MNTERRIRNTECRSFGMSLILNSVFLIQYSVFIRSVSNSQHRFDDVAAADREWAAERVVHLGVGRVAETVIDRRQHVGSGNSAFDRERRISVG